jgi:hypothetical protein
VNANTREPVRITTAPPSLSAERASRQRRYLISMAIRTACVVGAMFVPLGWPLALCLVGAIFLPYLAVVAANEPTAPRALEGLREVWTAKELESPSLPTDG